jgi:hypothetical protein
MQRKCSAYACTRARLCLRLRLRIRIGTLTPTRYLLDTLGTLSAPPANVGVAARRGTGWALLDAPPWLDLWPLRQATRIAPQSG